MSYFIFAKSVTMLNSPPTAKGELVARVVESIRSGLEPSIETLAASPLISDFDLIIRGNHAFLTGTVTGHPKIEDGPIFTSVVCAIDLDRFSWARTKNRFYRLSGPPQIATAVWRLVESLGAREMP